MDLQGYLELMERMMEESKWWPRPLPCGKLVIRSGSKTRPG